MRVHSAKPSWQTGHDLGQQCALADKLHWFSVACYQSAVLASVAAGSEQSAGRLHRGLASLGLCWPRDGPSRTIPSRHWPAAQGCSGLRWCGTPAPSAAVGAVQSVAPGFIFLTMVHVTSHGFHCSCTAASEHHQQQRGRAELPELCAARGPAGGHPL